MFSFELKEAALCMVTHHDQSAVSLLQLWEDWKPKWSYATWYSSLITLVWITVKKTRNSEGVLVDWHGSLPHGSGCVALEQSCVYLRTLWPTKHFASLDCKSKFNLQPSPLIWFSSFFQQPSIGFNITQSVFLQDECELFWTIASDRFHQCRLNTLCL